MRLLLTTTALLAWPLGLAAQAPIQLDTAKVDAVFKDYGTTTPGCALGIYQRGRVRFARGYGMADLSLGVPISPTTVFDIGSTSKQFAAASIVMLANEGKLSLADDVRKYVPELPSYGTTITIDHLLRHTSGLRDYNGLLYMAGHYFEDFTNDDDALAIIVKQRALNFEPGSRWDYSNTGFFLLSTIIKRVTNKTLAEFSKERIFTPLGMTVSHFRDDHALILANRATAYSPGGAGGFVIDMSNWDQTGDGAVNTNVLDLASWDGNFYDPRVGGQALIDRMQQRGTLNNGDSLSYARGLFIDKYRGLRRVHHGGAWAGYRAMLMRFPDQGIAIGVTCNIADANTQKRATDVADVLLGGAFTEAPKAAAPAAATAARPPAVDAAPYLGLYYADALQSVAEIAQDSGRMVARFMGRSWQLGPLGGDRFGSEGQPLEFQFSDQRRSLSVVVLGESQGPYLKTPSVTPTAADLETLVGSYSSPELMTTWTIRIDNGKAMLKGRAIGESALNPLIKDAYQADGSFVRFTRGANGRINGFDVSASRMLRIRFNR